MAINGFSCCQCGYCCHNHAIFQANEQDVVRWRSQERLDILSWVKTSVDLEGKTIHSLWFHPENGNPVKCPWLCQQGDDKYLCSIQETKPQTCHDYPRSLEQAQNTGCKGIVNRAIEV